MGMFSEIAAEAVIKATVAEIRKQIELNGHDLGAVLALKQIGQFMLTKFEWTAPEWAGEFQSLFSTDILNVHALEFFNKERFVEAGHLQVATRTYNVIKNEATHDPPQTLGQFLEKYKGSEGKKEFLRAPNCGPKCLDAVRDVLQKIGIPFN